MQMTEELRKQLLDCVPDNWLDPLLTGPSKVIGELLTNHDIERVCRGIKDRIAAVCASDACVVAPSCDTEKRGTCEGTGDAPVVGSLLKPGLTFPDHPVIPRTDAKFDAIGMLLDRVRSRRGSDQMRKLRGERPQDDAWPWIHETELVAAVEALLDSAPKMGNAEPAYESVGFQYRFPSSWGGNVWRDSPNSYNGHSYDASREIFARKAVVPSEVKLQ
jgi:hypothetical protein